MITKLTENEVFVKLAEMKLMHQTTIKFNDKKFIYIAPKEEVYYDNYIDLVENSTSNLIEIEFTTENNLRNFYSHMEEIIKFDLYVGEIGFNQILERRITLLNLLNKSLRKNILTTEQLELLESV